jgi:hypothetical protein
VSAKRKRESRQGCQRPHPIERLGSNRPGSVTRSREDEGTGFAFDGQTANDEVEAVRAS